MNNYKHLVGGIGRPNKEPFIANCKHCGLSLEWRYEDKRWDAYKDQDLHNKTCVGILEMQSKTKVYKSRKEIPKEVLALYERRKK